MRATAEGPGTPATLDSGLRLDEGVHADSLVGGYKPMAMPTVGEVATALAAYEAAHKVASDAKDAYEAAQLVVQGLRPAVDAQIVELWDAIEYFFRHLEPSTLRRSAREWGVVYASRSGDPEDPTPPTPPAAHAMNRAAGRKERAPSLWPPERQPPLQDRAGQGPGSCQTRRRKNMTTKSSRPRRSVSFWA